MIGNSFDPSANDSKNGELGHVLVHLSDDATRGRNHVFGSVARLFAERTGRAFVSLSESELKKLFEGNTTRQQNLETYVAKYGYPDVTFNKNLHSFPFDGRGYTINDLSSFIHTLEGYRKNLTCHHLTTERLAEEAKIFDSKHEDIRLPLIAVMLNRLSANPPYLVEKTLDMAATYAQATIYLCGSWRMKSGEHALIHKTFRQEILSKNLDRRINLRNFAINPEDSYNPYIGLIAKADHVIISGNSTSMISEVLFTGKTVMIDDYDYPTGLAKAGLIHDFNKVASLPTQPIEPINITSDVVDAMITRLKQRDFYVPEI